VERKHVEGEGGRERGREGEVHHFLDGRVRGEKGMEEGLEAAAVAAGVPQVPFLHQHLGKLQSIRLKQERRARGRKGEREISNPPVLEGSTACTAATATAAAAAPLSVVPVVLP